MSNSRKINQLADKRRAATKAKKRQAEVEEYEEVEIVDRRGNVRIDLQRVHQQAQPNPTTPSRSKRARQKSPSPIASGSKQSSRKPRKTKVCAPASVCPSNIVLLTFYIRVKTIICGSGCSSERHFCTSCLNKRVQMEMGHVMNAAQMMVSSVAWIVLGISHIATNAFSTVTNCSHSIAFRNGMANTLSKHHCSSKGMFYTWGTRANLVPRT